MNQKIEFGVSEEPLHDASMQEVPQDGMTFHEFVVQQGQWDLCLLFPAGSMNRAFSASPFEELPFHGARNGKGKVRLTLCDLLGAQHLQKNAQGLLGNIGAGEPQLLFGNAANRSVQYRNKSHNHEGLDKLRFDGTSREQFPEQVIGGRTGLRGLQVG